MQKEDLIETLKHQDFSKKILDAFSKVRREHFLPDQLKECAYSNTALPIGSGQTISQPYTIAVMLSMLDLRRNQKVLEIGSGSGYVLALLSEIVGDKGRVFGVERIQNLVERSIKALREYKNVQIYLANGKNGLIEESPFDRILISAACKKIPDVLLSQLKDKGIAVAPVYNENNSQDLVAIKKSGGNITIKETIPGFVFVPFVEED